jgi:phosphoenolpyruvate carboxykinase (ATP)
VTAFNLQEFAETAQRIRIRAIEEGRWIDNPIESQLKQLMHHEPGIKITRYGNFVAESDPTSRAARFTKNSIDHSFGEEEQELLLQCETLLAQEHLITIDRTVGNTRGGITVRLIVPTRFAHVAYGGAKLFRPIRKAVDTPTYQVLFFADRAYETNKTVSLPQKDITIRLAMLTDGHIIKIIRNSSYIGEFKKGVFAAEDWNAKTRRRGIFLHAGCREDYLQSVIGEYRRVRTLLLALSANGKTSTTCRILARKGREESWLIQDDGGTLLPDGSFCGFEGGGVFVKTEDVNPGDQREIFYGLLKPGTLLENVHMTEGDELDFYNTERTSNGRAVISRRDFMHASPYITVDRIDNIILITRGALIPAIAKLTREQAVAFTVLGQAMESSAGDPTHSGEIRSEFFYDPFVAGEKAAHANRFYTILQSLPHVNYYLLNTGGIGEGSRYKEITLQHTMGVLDSLLRGGFEGIWTDSPTGFKVPKAIRSVDDIFLHPERLYSQAEFRIQQELLQRFRRDAVEKLGSALHPTIRAVFSSIRSKGIR